jgi:hypothetical protein
VRARQHNRGLCHDGLPVCKRSRFLRVLQTRGACMSGEAELVGARAMRAVQSTGQTSMRVAKPSSGSALDRGLPNKRFPSGSPLGEQSRTIDHPQHGAAQRVVRWRALPHERRKVYPSFRGSGCLAFHSTQQQ